MSRLEDLLRLETANSSLAFRERAYGLGDRAELVRDLVALANANVTGPRFLFVGVRDELGGKRRFVGLAERAWSEQRELLRSLADAVDPPLNVTVRLVEIDGARIGMFCLAACDDPPYLLTESAGEDLAPGTGWVRRGTKRRPLLRLDLKRMFELKGAGTVADVRIGFGPGLAGPACRGLDAAALKGEIVLDVLPLDAMPSAVAAEKLRKLLDANVSARDVLGRTSTGIARLTHARLFGADSPFQSHGDNTLRARITASAEEHAHADRHYELEVRAHPLQVLVSNGSDTALKNATVALKLPCIDGVGVSEQRYPDANIPPTSEDYPAVRTGEHVIEIQTQIATIPPNATVPAFKEPPRLWLREPAAGKTIPVDCMLHAGELREPFHETLLIRVA